MSSWFGCFLDGCASLFKLFCNAVNAFASLFKDHDPPRRRYERWDESASRAPPTSPRARPQPVRVRATLNLNNASPNELKPCDIRFCQDSVANHFINGMPLATTIGQLRRGELSPHQILPIRVFKHRGLWFTEDNRRLKVFQEAGVRRIPVTLTSGISNSDKMTTNNQGRTIHVRGRY
jgi:hypothetical protein